VTDNQTPRDAAEETEMVVEFNTQCEHGSERHAAICEWLVEHGFDINVVPIDASVAVDGAEVTVEIYATEDDGKKILREDGEAWRVFRRVELLSEPSALVRGDA
jgi:hypothetical protein